MTKEDLVKLYHEVKQEAAPGADPKAKKVLRPPDTDPIFTFLSVTNSTICQGGCCRFRSVVPCDQN